MMRISETPTRGRRRTKANRERAAARWGLTDAQMDKAAHRVGNDNSPEFLDECRRIAEQLTPTSE